MSSKRPSRTVRRLLRVVVLLFIFCLLSSSPSLRKLLIVKNSLQANSLSEWRAKRSARECTSERRSREGQGRRRELYFFPALGSTSQRKHPLSPRSSPQGKFRSEFPCETSPAAKSVEKRMFSPARVYLRVSFCSITYFISPVDLFLLTFSAHFGSSCLSF